MNTDTPRAGYTVTFPGKPKQTNQITEQAPPSPGAWGVCRLGHNKMLPIDTATSSGKPKQADHSRDTTLSGAQGSGPTRRRRIPAADVLLEGAPREPARAMRPGGGLREPGKRDLRDDSRSRLKALRDADQHGQTRSFAPPNAFIIYRHAQRLAENAPSLRYIIVSLAETKYNRNVASDQIGARMWQCSPLLAMAVSMWNSSQSSGTDRSLFIKYWRGNRGYAREGPTIKMKKRRGDRPRSAGLGEDITVDTLTALLSETIERSLLREYTQAAASGNSLDDPCCGIPCEHADKVQMVNIRRRRSPHMSGQLVPSNDRRRPTLGFDSRRGAVRRCPHGTEFFTSIIYWNGAQGALLAMKTVPRDSKLGKCECATELRGVHRAVRDWGEPDFDWAAGQCNGRPKMTWSTKGKNQRVFKAGKEELTRSTSAQRMSTSSRRNGFEVKGHCAWGSRRVGRIAVKRAVTETRAGYFEQRLAVCFAESMGDPSAMPKRPRGGFEWCFPMQNGARNLPAPSNTRKKERDRAVFGDSAIDFRPWAAMRTRQKGSGCRRRIRARHMLDGERRQGLQINTEEKRQRAKGEGAEEFEQDRVPSEEDPSETDASLEGRTKPMLKTSRRLLASARAEDPRKETDIPRVVKDPPGRRSDVVWQAKAGRLDRRAKRD
ncbi:hypothetical protein DFH06DRAFT_1131350 [Mycena polygramma]|nr:hypothetical protein DFH06DRAFT_1131350 [Mycena polygramma]